MDKGGPGMSLDFIDWEENYSSHNPEQKHDPLKKKSSTTSSTPDRNHSKIWKEEVKLPERKRKTIPNPWG